MMPGRRDGFVLVAALWLVVALAAVALDAALRSQARRVPAVNLLDESRARQAALAGGEYARSRLTAAMGARETELRTQTQRSTFTNPRSATAASRFGSTAATAGRTTATRSTATSGSRLGLVTIGQAENPWREPMELMQPGVTLGDLHFLLDVRDTGLAVHLNLASEDMIRQLLTEGLRIDFPTADRLTQAMMDWIDGDSLPRINGAERDEYIAAGAAVLPHNRPFADAEELRHVMGMTPELLDLIAPYVTVIGSGRVNVNAAPEPVLAALPGFNIGLAGQLVRLRDSGQYPGTARELRELLGMSQTLTAAELQEFNRRVTYSTSEVLVTAEGYIEDSPVRARAMLVMAQASSGAVVVWRKVE